MNLQSKLSELERKIINLTDEQYFYNKLEHKEQDPFERAALKLKATDIALTKMHLKREAQEIRMNLQKS